MHNEVLELLSGRKGHFLLESGHHGDLWFDLETLCLRPQLVQRISIELANALSGLGVDVVCGALVEGAFVGLLVALKLDVRGSFIRSASLDPQRMAFYFHTDIVFVHRFVKYFGISGSPLLTM